MGRKVVPNRNSSRPYDRPMKQKEGNKVNRIRTNGYPGKKSGEFSQVLPLMAFVEGATLNRHPLRCFSHTQGSLGAVGLRRREGREYLDQRRNTVFLVVQ